MTQMRKRTGKSGLEVLAAFGLIGAAVSCGGLLNKDDDNKKQTTVANYTVTSLAEGLVATVSSEKNAEGTSAVLKLTDVQDSAQVIAITGTCPVGSFTALGEYTTGPIKADCQVVLKAGATASFAFAADALPKEGKAEFSVAPFGAYNLKKVVAGDCAAGEWTGSNYSAPVTAACTATFESAAAPVVAFKSNSAAHTLSYTVTPDPSATVTGSPYAVKFDGSATYAGKDGTKPQYRLAGVKSDTCNGNLDVNTMTFKTGPLQSASCTVEFDIANPCGDSGIADPTTIKYTSATDTDPNRIDRLLTVGNVVKSADAGTSNLGATGTGTFNCSTCHGANNQTTFSYGTKWKIYYNTTATGGSYGPSADWPQTDFLGGASASSSTGWTYKILAPGNGTNKPIEVYDPLNSRFYRKLTPSHYAADGTTSYSTRMPRTFSGTDCTTGAGGTCLSEAQQAMMCHWIWNGAQ